MLISPLIDDCSASLGWVDFLFFHHMRSILSTSCFSQSCKSSQGHSCTISVMDEIIQLPNPILSGTVTRSGNLSWSNISISCSYLLLIVRQQFSKYHSISPIHFQLSMSWTIEHSTRVELILTMVSYFLITVFHNSMSWLEPLNRKQTQGQAVSRWTRLWPLWHSCWMTLTDAS